MSLPQGIRTILSLAFVIALVACGNQTGAGGSEGSGGTAGQASATPSEPATPPPPPPPPPLKQRAQGDWDMPLISLSKVMPPEKAKNVLALYFAFRDEDPTEEEVKAAGFEGLEAIGIGVMREKRIKQPDDAKTIKQRAAYETMLSSLPSLKLTETNLVLGTAQKQDTSTYKIVAETAESLKLAVTDDEGETDDLTLTMPDVNTLVLSEEGKPDLVFHRHGVARQAAAAAAPPDLRNTPDAAKLFGRWNADGGNYGASFLQDGTYILHGQGGDTNGRYRVSKIEGNKLTLWTSLMPLSHDDIEVQLNDDGSLNWMNLGTKSGGRYTRAQ